MKMNVFAAIAPLLLIAGEALAGEKQPDTRVRPHFQVGSVYSVTGTFHCEGRGSAKTQRGSGSASGTIDANFEIQIEVLSNDGEGRPQRTRITVVEYRRRVHPLFVTKEDRDRERYQKRMRRRVASSPYEGQSLLVEPTGDGVAVYDEGDGKRKPKRIKRVDGDLWRLIDEVLYATWTWQAPKTVEKGDQWTFDPALLLRLNGMRIPEKVRKEEDSWHGTGRASVSWANPGQSACIAFKLAVESRWETNDMVCEVTGHTTLDPDTGLTRTLQLHGNLAFRTTKRSGMNAAGHFELALAVETLTCAPITGEGAADLDRQVTARIAALRGESDGAARDAAVSLAALGGRAHAAVPALTVVLGHENPKLRSAAARALGRIRATDATVVQALTAALEDEDEDVRVAAIRALGAMDDAAVKPLTAVLQGKDTDLQREAALALAELGPAAKSAVRALARAVKDQKADEGVRRAAAQALGEIGPDAKGARGALKSAIRNGLPGAKEALNRIRAR